MSATGTPTALDNSSLTECITVAVSERTGKRVMVGTILVGVLLVAFLGVGFPLIRTAQEDPYAECAKKYESRKTDLTSDDWTWVPPGWACRFTEGTSGRVP